MYAEDITRGLLADKLILFQRKYAPNPIGAFKYLLKKAGIVNNSEVFDLRARVDQEMIHDLDAMAASKDYQDLIAWGKT
ncbi:MAG: hypothetical protein QF486_01060 [Candidatus Woesearchaeota archaeon]|nr:hypothetical protein [Candidatus Woesearchaeota archaeon]MDP7181192.1 hypothetical protein [Candidatus Woesearchaeota archaeon]MDP7198187.1 hypothetical protein [Candidatus Woesearchaeota archaeon]MDP7467023.1 hypothetical protein [Candidatus Woesearchaeota archaeon]MDP7646692.1 hypothetical protein [Candidatus Woesearchaeota archaeon]